MFAAGRVALALTLGASAAQLSGQGVATPRTGDWEGVADGFHASFELIHNPINRAYGAEPYGIYNLIMTEPNSCPTDTGQLLITTEGSRKYQLLIGPSGDFPWHQHQKTVGWITGPRAASGHTSYDVRQGRQTCRGVLHFRFHPAHRRLVDDGKWRLSFSDGEHQNVDVMGGGRFTAVSFPKVAASCPSGSGGTAFGGIEVFIPADGRVDQPVHFNPGTVTLRWKLTSAHTGHGSFIASYPGCQPGTLSFRARH
jgi:hypothetical protein